MMPATGDPLSTWSTLTATGALLAFLVGIYSMVGRDRKSPYLINSVFLIFAVCILGAFFDVLSVILSAWKPRLLLVGQVALALGALLTFWRVWIIWTRLAHFIDGGIGTLIRNSSLIRIPKRLWRQMSGHQVYEHNTVPLSGELLEKVRAIVTTNAEAFEGATPSSTKSPYEIDRTLDATSLAIALRHQGQANVTLAELATQFLLAGLSVQYMTASRHPIEFIRHLKSNWPNAKPHWAEVAKRIVVVDAFTPHFGFLDSINGKCTLELRSLFGVTVIPSTDTYAGMHSASSRAFNILKRSVTSEVRQPQLVIYEDSYAISDLESVEQYRVFIRHVIPSERIWSGMFTVVVETAQREEDWRVLQSYTSMVLDLRNDAHESHT